MSASGDAAVRATEPPRHGQPRQVVGACSSQACVRRLQAAVGLDKAYYFGPAKNAMRPSRRRRGPTSSCRKVDSRYECRPQGTQGALQRGQLDHLGEVWARPVAIAIGLGEGDVATQHQAPQRPPPMQHDGRLRPRQRGAMRQPRAIGQGDVQAAAPQPRHDAAGQRRLKPGEAGDRRRGARDAQGLAHVLCPWL